MLLCNYRNPVSCEYTPRMQQRGLDELQVAVMIQFCKAIPLFFNSVVQPPTPPGRLEREWTKNWRIIFSDKDSDKHDRESCLKIHYNPIRKVTVTHWLQWPARFLFLYSPVINSGAINSEMSQLTNQTKELRVVKNLNCLNYDKERHKRAGLFRESLMQAAAITQIIGPREWMNVFIRDFQRQTRNLTTWDLLFLYTLLEVRKVPRYRES